MYYSNKLTWAGFQNHLIRPKFNPKRFMENYTYVRQFYQET